MDGEEKVKIFEWRQENVTTKKSTDILKGSEYFLYLVVSMPKIFKV